MQNELMNQGLTLMLAGMGTVFVFLTTLVVAMSLMS
ncbi:MAG: OadG family transporter subunit, partial [Gammaproteobacteria bacterium]|nr:OadG family transporter subunit [Gammaproteobacteria bacterium]